MGLHALAPRAVHGCSDVVVPMLPNGTLVANLAVDGVGLDQRQPSDDAWLPMSLAVAAGKRALVDLTTAVLAPSCWKGLTD